VPAHFRSILDSVPLIAMLFHNDCMCKKNLLHLVHLREALYRSCASVFDIRTSKFKQVLIFFAKEITTKIIYFFLSVSLPLSDSVATFADFALPLRQLGEEHFSKMIVRKN
jgi:hypothetical protein